MNKGISLRMISIRPNDQLGSNQQSIINVKQSSKKNTKNEEKAAHNIDGDISLCFIYLW